MVLECAVLMLSLLQGLTPILAFWVGVFLVVVLECKGVLNETCLTFELLVMESTIAVRTSFTGDLEFH